MKRLVLVIDCGATSVRAGAVDEHGTMVRSESRPNAAVEQFPGSGLLVWDLEDIWKKTLRCASDVVRRMGADRFAALAVTSFSDDGAPFDEKGGMLYPVISWQCQRTAELARSIDTRIDPDLLFRITGEQPLHQHTLFRLLWFREHEPRVFERMHRYLMFPGIITRRLTGESLNDPTTADSMMLLDIRKRAYSPALLKMCGLDESRFPPLAEPGTVIGPLLPRAARSIGLKKTVPVVMAGHDTQFAVYGSGCAPGGAVLSSGTWEILFVRGQRPLTGAMARNAGIKNECDALPGTYDTGLQWIGSGVLEWVKARFAGAERGRRGLDRVMQREASAVPPGCRGLAVEPSFIPGAGSWRLPAGSILGLDMQTDAARIYRAAIEGLSFTLRRSLERIEKISGKEISSLVMVGGGSANALWNRVRADVLGRPVCAAERQESTVLGAAMFAFTGAGIYGSAEEARGAFNIGGKIIEPGKDRGIYQDLYESHLSGAHALKKYYRTPGRRG